MHAAGTEFRSVCVCVCVFSDLCSLGLTLWTKYINMNNAEQIYAHLGSSAPHNFTPLTATISNGSHTCYVQYIYILLLASNGQALIYEINRNVLMYNKPILLTKNWNILVCLFGNVLNSNNHGVVET